MNETKTFLSAAITLLLLFTIFFFIERMPWRGTARVQRAFRLGWFTDVLYWFVTSLLTQPFMRLVLLGPVAFLVIAEVVPTEAFKAGRLEGFGPLSRQPVWLQAVQIYVLMDFIGYWIHRTFHRPAWWPFHAVHHSSEVVDWLSSLRVHPVGELVNKLSQSVAVMMLGYNPVAALAAAPVLAFHAMFIHANVNWDFGPLRWVIASPVFHRWHHSQEREAWDKNFAGLIPLWDIFFGTFYMPRGRYPESFGISRPMPHGFLGQMLAPFAWLIRRVLKADCRSDSRITSSRISG